MNSKKLDILCEIVRFQKSILMQYNEVSLLSPAKGKKIKLAFERFDKKVVKSLQDELNVDLIDITNSMYEEGLPVEPMNAEDFEGEDYLIISNMLEPIVKERGTSNIIRQGKVILAKPRTK